MMNTLISFLILLAAIVVNLLALPVVVKIFGESRNVALISGMIVLAIIDLLVRIIDLRRTKEEINVRLISPKCGGSFVLAPVWILALVMSLYVKFGW